MKKYSQLLLKFSGVFALIGAILGAHMAGSGSYAFRPVHAHILVVGWLSLFAFSVFYKVFQPKQNVLSALHVWSAIIGTIGLTIGMWLYNVKPFDLPEGFTLAFYIIGGTILLISFALFFILTLLHKDSERK